MAIIKSVKNSHSSIKHIINYITKDEKTIGKNYAQDLTAIQTPQRRKCKRQRNCMGKQAGEHISTLFSFSHQMNRLHHNKHMS